MKPHGEISNLLPFYAAGTLDELHRHAVEEHLPECAACRAELALWLDVGGATVDANEALPQAPERILVTTLSRIGDERPGMLGRAWVLLYAQILLLRREIWLAALAVMAIGYVVAIIINAGTGSARIVEAIAPLLAAASIAMIYGPENDPALEVTLATPTAPAQVLLARLVLVFGYDLALALTASLGLVFVMPSHLLGAVIIGWLAPMTFLSALALVLSMRLPIDSVVAISSFLWLSKWMSQGFAGSIPASFGSAVQSFAVGWQAVWDNSALLFVLAGLLLIVALYAAGKQGRYASQTPGSA